MRSLRWPASKQKQKALKKSKKKVSNADLKQAEEARWYGSIVEFSDEAIIAKNLEGIISAWSTGAQRMFGYTKTEAIGQPITIIIPPELLDEEKDILRRLRAGERIEHYETRRVSKDGKKIDVSITVSPVRDAEGRIIGASKIVRDITESKRAEALLRKSEERFRLAAQAGKMFAYEWDVATDLVERSGESVQILGIGESTPITAQELMAMVHPGDRERVTAAIAELSPEKSYLQVSYRRVRPDGTVIWVERIGRAHFDEQGRMVQMVGMTVDITERKLAERELAQANERLRLAMESGKLTGWDRDVKSGRDSLFGDLQSMFGIPSEIYDGRVDDFHRYLHPEDRPRVVEAIDYAMETHKPYAAEFRLRWPDGTVRWLAAKGKFYYSQNGEPERMLGVAIDITDRKLAEEALRESEERFRLAAQAGRMYAFDWDVTTDVILRSEEITRLPGLAGEPTNLTKQQLLARIHPEDRATFSSSITELTPERPNTQISFRLLRPDGSVVWLERTGYAFFDEQGKMVRMIGMVADITERRRSEEPLRRSESYLSQAERLAHSGTWAWDACTRETFWSREMFRILGYEPEKTSPSLSDFLARVHPEDRLRAEQRVREEASGLDVVSDYRIVLPDGSIRHLQAIGHPIKNESGEVVEVVGTTVDITERKQAEEALSRVGGRLIEAHEEERTRIARELHDDVGQRLVLLAWHLGSSNGDLRKQVEDLVNDVQALSHQLHSPKLDYLGLAAAAAGFCKELSDRQRVEIEFHSENIPKELPKEISLCLFRVLQEALQNAIKHSGSRHFQVSLRVRANEIELTVHDSGIGFETDEAIKGRGLGLTSMQERLKLVDGELSIDSKPQRGTTIHARVPLSPRMKSVGANG